jgi:hypothetical protein
MYTDGSLLEERSGAGVYNEVDRQSQVTMSERLPPFSVPIRAKGHTNGLRTPVLTQT